MEVPGRDEGMGLNQAQHSIIYIELSEIIILNILSV